MGDWDDDDFELDTTQVDEKVNITEEIGEERIEEKLVPKPQPGKPKSKSKQKDTLKSFATDLGRELTEKEKEEIQRRSDLDFAQDLLGTSNVGPTPYSELTTVEEFREYGEELGRKLAARANASHYVEMLIVLLKVAVANIDANKARQLSTALKTITDEKSNAEKKTKAKGSAAKPSMKISQKANAKLNKGVYDDYVGDVDNYDDYEDDFM